MTKKDLYIIVALLIDVLVILTYSVSDFDGFLIYFGDKPEAGFIFWLAFIYLFWNLSQSFFKSALQFINKPTK